MYELVKYAILQQDEETVDPGGIDGRRGTIAKTYPLANESSSITYWTKYSFRVQTEANAVATRRHDGEAARNRQSGKTLKEDV